MRLITSDLAAPPPLADLTSPRVSPGVQCWTDFRLSTRHIAGGTSLELGLRIGSDVESTG